MGDLEKTVKILFQGDDQVSNTIKSLSGNLGDFSGAITDIASPWADLADNIIKVDAALAALAVGGLAYAYSKAIEFEGSIVELNKVLGDDSSADLEAASNAAIDLSNAYGQSATSILSSTANFKQAGYTVQEAMQLTKDAMDLVIVGDMEASEASALLISTLKGFKAPATEAGRLMDVLNETSNNYATNVEELATSMADISPIASQMGFSFEETAGILTPVIEVFRSGDEVSRAFRTGLLNLTSDTPRVTQALAELGISQTDVNGQMKSGRDIFYEVQAVFQNLTDTEKTYYAQQLVGKDQAAKMALAFDSMNQTLAVTETAMGAAGSAAAEVNTYLQSGPVAVQRFTAAFENLSIAVGDQFRAAATEAINGGTEIEIALQNLIKDGTFDEIFGKIEDFAKDLGETFEAIAENMPEAFKGVDFSDLLKSFDTLGLEIKDAFKNIWGDIDLTTPEGLANVIQKVVDGFTALINTSTGIVQGLQPMFTAIGYAIDNYSDLDDKTQEIVGTFLGAAKTITTIVDNLDLFGAALVPLAGASMVNAIANLVSFGSSATTASTSMTSLTTVLKGVGVASAGVVGWSFGTWLRDWIPEIDTGVQSIYKFVDSIINFSGQKGNVDLEENLSTVATNADAAKENIEAIPEEKQTIVTIDGVTRTVEQLKLMQDYGQDLTITVTADEKSVEQAKNYIEIELEDGTTQRIYVEADQESAQKAQKEVSDILDPSKKLEIQTELDKEKLETAKSMFSDLTETMNTAIEWDAKLNIASLEAETEQVKATMESLGVSISAVSDTVSTMFSSLSEGSGAHFYELYDLLSKEINMQESLVAAETRLANAQAARIESGEPIGIQVESSALAPALEMIFTEIMEMAQVTANAEGLSLLGVES